MSGTARFAVERLVDGPLIHVDDDPALEGNLNGPSLIRVPDWVREPLGRYYLYFAHHEGRSIRLAYANELTGPWCLHHAGALRLEDSGFPVDEVAYEDLNPYVAQLVDAGMDGRYAHIASPDVLIDESARTVRLYYHGRLADGSQRTRVASSRDGLNFTAGEALLGRPYFRVFRHQRAWYALAMPGVLYQSDNGLTGFEAGPRLFNQNMRHSAVQVSGNQACVFWTQVGDAPERVLVSSIELDDDWRRWRDGDASEVLRPQQKWEGAELPLEPSRRGGIMTPVNQLRDPAIFEEAGRTYLLYAAAGEQALGIVSLVERST